MEAAWGASKGSGVPCLASKAPAGRLGRAATAPRGPGAKAGCGATWGASGECGAAGAADGDGMGREEGEGEEAAGGEAEGEAEVATPRFARRRRHLAEEAEVAEVEEAAEEAAEEIRHRRASGRSRQLSPQGPTRRPEGQATRLSRRAFVPVTRGLQGHANRSLESESGMRLLLQWSLEREMCH